MSDLIRRSDAINCVGWGNSVTTVIDRIKALPSAEVVHKPDYSYEADMVRRMKEALSADAVEVVRCKDCKFYTDAGTIPNKSCCGFCTKLGSVSYYGVDGTDYCSFGERREP